MVDMPYYYEESGLKKYGEGLIPIVILVLIGVVLIGKTTTAFCGMPGLDQVLCTRGGNVIIGVIGNFAGTGDDPTQINAANLESVLNNEGARYGIYWRPINEEILEFPREKLLSDFDAVMVVGDTTLSYAVRDAIGNYIAGGGNVILVGDAGTQDPNDPLICGWSSAAFGDHAPVRMSPVGGMADGCVKQKIITGKPVLSFWGEHPVLHDVAEQYSLDLTKTDCKTIKAIDVVPRTDLGAETIAMLTGTGDGKEIAVPGIVEKATTFGGKVIYFDYDPGCTRSIAIATLRYVSGA